MNNERGMTLIEVVASIVIISIVLISFFQLFTQGNTVAARNNEKLVVINLANAELERLKITEPSVVFGTGTNKLNKPGNTNVYNPNHYTKQTTINGSQYEVLIHATGYDADAKLVIVEVTATGKNNVPKSKVEGYLKYE
jgi:prepilin-type N-terminal cleavage/methylation domain-containing protein